MTSLSGQIGPYTIDREIGRGGMGVVYKATDSRLHRTVAIKALPEHLATDPDRLGRFEREARTLASLSHPNVAGIHGLEEHEGRKYLVLEFVEGETLADRIDRGPLPIDDALEICAQVAAGLEAAHDAGVIHRDLKPANIKITPDGEAKVLDFGLARSDEQQASSSGSVSQAPTITTPEIQHSPTIPGAILGTAPYMSPEQARGRKVDRRSDIWSLGIVLYECLTGLSPFVGETTTDTIGAILHKDVDLNLLPPQTPARVRDLLKRMLTKDKADRQRDAGDVLIELRIARASPDGGDIAGIRKGIRAPVIVAALAAALVATFVTFIVVSGPLAGDTSRRPGALATSFVQVTDAAGPEDFSTLSPDGEVLVYSALSPDGDRDIYSLRTGGRNAVNLTPNSSANDTAPKFSPDGSQIVFVSGRDGGGIWVMGATGESPRRLTDFGGDPAWSPDGSEVVFASSQIFDPYNRLALSSLWVVSTDGGAARKIYDGDAVQPSWSPNGHRIAFWRLSAGGQRDLATIPAIGGEPVVLTNDAATDWNPVWSPDGGHVYFCSDRNGAMSVWRLAVDERTGEPNGAPEPVTVGESALTGHFTIASRAPRIAYSLKRDPENLQRFRLDPATGAWSGEAEWITHLTSKARLASVSPDGTRIVFTSVHGQEDLVVMDLDGGNRVQLTNDAAKDRAATWSADGKWIIFSSDRDGAYGVFAIRPDGSGIRRLSDIGEPGLVGPKMSPDGKTLSVTTFDQTYLAEWSEDDGALDFRLKEWSAEPGESLGASGWSPDGARMIAGIRRGQALVGYAAVDVVSGDIVWRSEKIDSPVVEWFDDRRLLAIRGESAIDLVDIETGETTELFDVSPDYLGVYATYDAASGYLYVARRTLEADIWVADLPEE